jgi:hypothetical protein
MPANGFASFLSALTGHARLRLAKAQPVVMASERGWTRFGVYGNQFIIVFDVLSIKQFFH